MTTRSEVVAFARTCVGTRFAHRGRVPGVALDCAGLLICTARALGLVSPNFDVPEYTGVPDGTLESWCDRYMTRIAQADMQVGDAIAVITDQDPQHLGILADYRHGGLSIIHASNDRLHKRVIEHRLMFSRSFRFAAAWRLPGVS